MIHDTIFDFFDQKWLVVIAHVLFLKEAAAREAAEKAV